MRILLDTHVLIWLVEGDKNLSAVARSAIEDERRAGRNPLASAMGSSLLRL
jgi:PIN domain nuclease of toxin-antitoxin system